MDKHGSFPFEKKTFLSFSSTCIDTVAGGLKESIHSFGENLRLVILYLSQNFYMFFNGTLYIREQEFYLVFETVVTYIS